MHSKSRYRKELWKAMKSADSEKLHKLSLELSKSVLEHPILKRATTILSYHSFGNELNTHWLNEQLIDEKKLLLPVIDGNELVLRRVTKKTSFEKKPPFYIAEPQGGNFTDFEKVDLVLVPCLAFDKKNQRLGKGKGYYDRLLSKIPNAYKLGLCHHFQLLDELPTEDHDVAMDEVIVAKHG